LTAPVGKVQIGLAAGCTVLVAVLITEIVMPISSYEVPVLTLAKRTQLYISDFYSPPSDAAFNEIEQRPIFTARRKPTEGNSSERQPGLATVPPLQNAMLVGIIKEGDTQLALIKIRGTPFASSVAVGEQIQGWQLTELTADKAVLRAGMLQTVLTLGGPTSSIVPTRTPSLDVNTRRPTVFTKPNNSNGARQP